MSVVGDAKIDNQIATAVGRGEEGGTAVGRGRGEERGSRNKVGRKKAGERKRGEEGPRNREGGTTQLGLYLNALEEEGAEGSLYSAYFCSANSCPSLKLRKPSCRRTTRGPRPSCLANSRAI